MMKNKDIKFLAVVCLLMQGICSYAQLSTYESPVSFSKNHLQWHASAVTLPVLDMKAISREDSIDNEKDLPPRFGFPHKVNLNLENAGEWKVLPNGDRLWNLTITCPGAKSINLLYDKYWLPEGAKLFVYSKDKKRSIGAFTSKNNKGTKDELRGFATGLIYSDTVVVEYFEPKEVAYKGVVSIAYVVQGYRYINIYEKNSDYGSSGNCQVNINCQEGQSWQNEKRAVALILVDGYRYCTGSLINTTANDNTPLFLTANHCISGWADAISNPNLDHYSFWWNYESPDCNNPSTEPSHQTTNGAVVIANNSISDFALLSLTEDPKNNPNIKPYYLGWDRSGNAGEGGVCIHHPSGDVKKISTYTIQPTSTNYMYSATNNSFSHWRIVWNVTTTNHGTTEGGSSGSALLNKSHKVIGQLHGGYSSCDDKNSPDWYGKFNVSWTGNGAVDNRRKLQPWLDPQNTGATTLDGIGTTPDLYVRDFSNDNGSEPHSEYCTWESPDIWLEDTNGNIIDSATGNERCKVCVRIHNRSNTVSQGTEKLFLNWAKAGTNEYWYDNWTSLYPMPCGSYKGGTIGNPNGMPIPVIPAHGNTVMRVDWWAPSPDDYTYCTEFDAVLWHFCLMARIHDGYDIAHENEQFAEVHDFIRNHNNVASRNISVKSGSTYKAVINVGNAKPINLGRSICMHPQYTGIHSITDYAEVYITLDNGLLAALNSSNISGMEWVNGNTLRWTGGSTCIPVTLPANSNYTLMTTVHFLADQTPATGNFDFDIVLRSAVGDSILGGEHYRCIRTDGRWFQALASAAADVDAITFSAEELDEDAVYEWFDMNGNFLFEGTEYTLTGAESGCYVLRVTASADGYRAYSTLCVTLPDAMLSSIYPNPADGEVSIGYQLSRRIAGGTIQIVSANGVKMYSQAVTNTTKGKTMKGTLKLSTAAFAPGQYIVRILSSKGEVYDSKTLIVK